MNPKIRDLYSKAGLTMNNELAYEQWYLDALEKFAELVAEETYVFMCDATSNDKPWPSFGDVKQHFGVEQ